MADFGTEIITEKMVGMSIAEAFPTMKEEIVSLAKAGVFDPTPAEIAAKPPTCTHCLDAWIKSGGKV
jgi:hypothetical protein